MLMVYTVDDRFNCRLWIYIQLRWSRPRRVIPIEYNKIISEFHIIVLIVIELITYYISLYYRPNISIIVLQSTRLQYYYRYLYRSI